MPAVPSGALHTQSDSLSLWLWSSVRLVCSYLAWGLMISLISAAACYCCGYGAYVAYLRRHPPARRPRDPDPIAEEAARGVAEIEAYLIWTTPHDLS